MNTLLVEPSVYVYAEESGGSFNAKNFNLFWNLFDRFRRLVESNDSRIFLNADIRSAITNLFPYSLLGSVEHRSAIVGNPFTAAGVIVRFLDKYAVQPVRNYAGCENVSCEEELVRQSAVYIDEDIWLAWRDLVGQLANEWCEANILAKELLRAEDKFSCVGNDCRKIKVSLSGKSLVELLICHLSKGSIPELHIDPDLLDKLIEKRTEAGALTFSYEDSGHQPSREIKKVIQRTAQDAENIVIRMNTIYYNPDSTLPCKLFLDEEFNKVGFRITDGKEVVKGFFTTLAQSKLEQQAAFRYLERFFRHRCSLSSLPYTND